jgi:ATP-dependent helicase/nuclease subunit A
VALHALLERMTHGNAWPLPLPAASALVRWLGCRRRWRRWCTLRRVVLAQPQLERFFNPALHRWARNEMEIVSASGVMRLDRVVMFDDEVWVLDYKRRLLESERADYAAQLARYRSALVSVFSDKRIRSALITADGALLEH